MNNALRRAMGEVMRRECRLAARKPSQWLQPLVFFSLVVTLFPLSLSPSPDLLKTLAPGVLWVAALLSSTLSLERLFANDFEEGVLEQWVLSPHPLWVLIACKIAVHWFFSGVTLMLLAPLAAMSLAIPSSAVGVVMGSLALGTVCLSLLGAIGAALTLSARRSSSLLSLITLPMALPILIFGARAMDLASQGQDTAGALWLLGSLCVLSVSLALPAVTAAVRIAME
jgi:heme exporter protein B